MFTQEKVKFAAYILVLVGALNWLAIGLKGVDYVATSVGQYAKFIYITVGVAGLFLTVTTAIEWKKKFDEEKGM